MIPEEEQWKATTWHQERKFPWNGYLYIFVHLRYVYIGKGWKYRMTVVSPTNFKGNDLVVSDSIPTSKYIYLWGFFPILLQFCEHEAFRVINERQTWYLFNWPNWNSGIHDFIAFFPTLIRKEKDYETT